MLVPLGLSDRQLQALLPRYEQPAALELAVRCGSAGTARTLVAAGASRTEGAFRALGTLAKAESVAAGGEAATAAAAAVPAAVQALAEALLGPGLPQQGAHAALARIAVHLAYPNEGWQPCHWLLDRL